MLDLFQMSQLRSLVIEQLLAIGGRQHGDSIKILCPFHTDSKPSLHVHTGYELVPGSFNCFGCSAKGNWNKLAQALSFPTWDFHKSNESLVEEDTSGLSAYMEASQKLFQPKEAPTLNGIEKLESKFTWREYHSKFYSKLDAKLYWNRKFDQTYLYFPLTMNKKYMGYTLCALDKNPENKYLIFAEANKIFFLYDQIPNDQTIVLVEGHYDALRLFGKGFYAIAIFGIKNWGDVKRELLMAKTPKKVIIAFDGDLAGYQGAQIIFNDLRFGCNVDIFYLPIAKPKIDPGNMNNHYLQQLRSNVLLT